MSIDPEIALDSLLVLLIELLLGFVAGGTDSFLLLTASFLLPADGVPARLAIFLGVAIPDLPCFFAGGEKMNLMSLSTPAVPLFGLAKDVSRP